MLAVAIVRMARLQEGGGTVLDIAIVLLGMPTYMHQ